VRHIAPATALVGGLWLALIPQTYGQSPPEGHLMVAPADLKWTSMPSLPCGAELAVIEGPMNEAKPFTFRLKIPADCKIPPHWHPAIEHVTVISGTLNMCTGDMLDTSKTMPVRTGGIFIVQPSIHHFGWTSGGNDRASPRCRAMGDHT
jgi:hypothetical protein